METHIHSDLAELPEIIEANDILRSCVHCGFCTATCPTYQLLGDELDGPRGRIYLIKNLLEENQITDKAAVHLDQCLVCRACETTCPSGVKYSRLLEISRDVMRRDKSLSISRWKQGFISTVFRAVLPNPALFVGLVRIGQFFLPILPRRLAEKVPRANRISYPSLKAPELPIKRVIVLNGCVQKGATPQVNNALEFLLTGKKVAVTFITGESCCGSVDLHLSASASAVKKMKLLIDQLYPLLSTTDAIVSTASGCGVTLKEYPQLLQYEEDYLQKAAAVSAKIVDACELMSEFDFQIHQTKRIAFHSPCTLQHGQQLAGKAESILTRAGFDLLPVADNHLCCGSAGTYSLTQPALAGELLDNKLANLESGNPDIIATANIGCQLHLNTRSNVSVIHWLELLANEVS